MNGFGWMAAENAGPGAISMILEAQASLRGEASHVDGSTEQVQSLRVLRNMIFGKKLRVQELSGFLTTLTGYDQQLDKRFWRRFAKDALAKAGSHESVMLQQLCTGRGVGAWSPCQLPWCVVKPA